jgi:sugar phosphate isomerase/epimerase
MALDLDDLTMCFAGFRVDPTTCDRDGLVEMVDAGVENGFRGASLWALLIGPLAAAGLAPKDIARVCGDHGMQIRMVEALTEWTSGDRAAIDKAALPLFALARDLGAEEILTVTMDGGDLDVDRAASGFAYACDLAARDGLRLAIEFLPWSAVPTIAVAWQIVERAGRHNGGLVLDTWHWQRQPGGPDHETLRRIPGERIHMLQVNDAAPVPLDDVLAETMAHRLLPGEGAVDFVTLRASLDAIGAEPNVAPEIFNPVLAGLGPAELARRVAAATRHVLGA